MPSKKDSYISTRRYHTIPFSALRSYGSDRANDYHLTPESYQVLINYINYAPVASLVAAPVPHKIKTWNERRLIDEIDLSAPHGRGSMISSITLPPLAWNPTAGRGTGQRRHRAFQPELMLGTYPQTRRTRGDGLDGVSVFWLSPSNHAGSSLLLSSEYSPLYSWTSCSAWLFRSWAEYSFSWRVY